MRIVIEISVNEEDWRKDAPEATRKFEFIVPADIDLLANISIGKLTAEAIISAIAEYNRLSNPPTGDMNDVGRLARDAECARTKREVDADADDIDAIFPLKEGLE